jgi:hypothetical protein
LEAETMIELHHQKGLTVPLILCDTCGKEITDAGNAVVAWHFDSEHAAGRILPIRFAHKGACDHAGDNRWACSMELDVFLVYLLNNAKVRLKDAEYRAAFLSRL